MSGDGIYLDFDSDAPGLVVGDLKLVSVSGGGGLSEPFSFLLELETQLDGGLAPETIDELLSSPCRVHYGPQQEHSLSGVLSQIRLRPTWESTRATYEATLVPRLSRAALTYRSRVFQDADVTAILRRVLVEDLGLVDGTDFQIQCTQGYPVREYTVQYEETDLAFVSRLMEHWGLFYFFEHTPDIEVLHITDANQGFTDHATGSLPYRQRTNVAGHEGECVTELFATTRVQTASVRVRDYNWRRPSQPIDEAVDADVQGVGLSFAFGDHVRDENEAGWIAQVRAERLLSQKRTFEGSARSDTMMAGHVFELLDHPFAELDQRYVVTRVEHRFAGGAEAGGSKWQVRFEAIAQDVPWRSERRTPKPRVAGIVNAKVDGEVAGSAAPIDEHGRYKVVLPYDLVAEEGGRASRWIRMAQSSAGDGYGHHFPLHIGTEVAVAHINGDPDRPVIVGAVPNAETRSPVVSENPTQSRIRSRTGILIELDDDCD